MRSGFESGWMAEYELDGRAFGLMISQSLQHIETKKKTKSG
jgi:hypothetical protein